MLLSLAAASALPVSRVFGQNPQNASTLISLDVQVFDKHSKRPIPGLAPEDFLVTEDTTPASIASFDDTSIPLNMLLLLDVSGDTRNQGVFSTAKAISELRLSAEYIALMTFADSEAKWRSGFAKEPGFRIAFPGAVGDRSGAWSEHTRLYDAIVTGAEMFNGLPPRVRRLMVVVTHNREANSQATREQAIQALLESSISLEAITIPQQSDQNVQSRAPGPRPRTPSGRRGTTTPYPGQSLPRYPGSGPSIPGIGRIPGLGGIPGMGRIPGIGHITPTPNFWMPQGPSGPIQPRPAPQTTVPTLLEDLHSIEPIAEAAGGLTTRLGFPADPTGSSEEAYLPNLVNWDVALLESVLKDVFFPRLRTQYTLGIYSTAQEPEPLHRVAVDLSEEARGRYPDAELRTRSGYSI